MRLEHFTEPTPIATLYDQLEECRTLLAIAVSCADFTDTPEINESLQEELRVRIVWLTNEITTRLEKL
jgi:hypothetical protein